ncbi:bifunctional diaminohydroxyphosphoribosylaminopyrimidine deaminase/5-amino-6-(5-phosphoribosylamino)uracil reductase RibD [Wenyingzhuangia sp. chi5]|uniref:Riboflavin biosynthesis protein RibD n=1 Tax=Wenyingzhuangia gilva TaxID=3057677 RepID=A0ABT8VT01_9FLAO|nr:bifunctional diaminohydroxyphosphoribosylaminopyrimidine deaminase/5-amino-6-(5-phosphoribosylamino)uracil reductase RibD [Wenyingzhuangia sp. chi5]MDO3695099.1 bifunctional diaminohydroxyphosphoribosylaminopyrimidine deaminase/5-amino-6-(5-phosphoribosylamino)uracil reductase RibD [Wenyingzhuangia sp. chi5]
MLSIHETFMQRAVSLAKKGTRLAYPNPCVGAVIVCDGKIIGEGYTSAYGGPHAEVNAINSVQDESLLGKSTLYVTLEPCAHYGKTPPCANLIEAKNIPKIYIGCIDTFAAVSGKGIEILLKAGREVHVGVLEDECIDLHKRFFTYHNKKRPYIVLKWAETQDGFIDKEREVSSVDEAKPTWISNELSKQKVHQIRATEHAIMVGTNTALKDNPTLTTRLFGGVSPIRILIDKNLRVPNEYHLYNGEIKTIVFTEQETNSNLVQFKKIDFSKNILSQIMEVLYQEKIQSVLVEGGKQLLNSFIEQNLWDEAFVFVGNDKFEKGVEAPVLEVSPSKTFVLGTNSVRHYIKEI